MQNLKTTAGETAIRTMVIIRDCHSKNNILVPIQSADDEAFFGNLATQMGWLHTMRRKETEMVSAPAKTAWRKPSAIGSRPRPRLGGAFKLSLTPIKKGGAE